MREDARLVRGAVVESRSRSGLGLGQIIDELRLRIVVDWPHPRQRCSYSSAQSPCTDRSAKHTFRVHSVSDLKVVSPLIALAHSLD